MAIVRDNFLVEGMNPYRLLRCTLIAFKDLLPPLASLPSKDPILKNRASVKK